MRLRTAVHEARIDVITGTAFLIRPLPADDVRSPLGGPSLHEADFTRMIELLRSHHVDPTEGEDGGFCHDGFEPDGRERIGLDFLDSVVALPTMRQCAEAHAGLESPTLT